MENMQGGLNALMDGWQEWDTPAKRLKGARSARGLTQDQLSEDSGVKQSDISKLERGDSLTTAKWPQLARALDVDAYWLAGGDGEPERDALAAIRPPTVRQAVRVIAEALMHMDEIDREAAQSALSIIAKDPNRADKAIKMLDGLMASPPPPPAPTPAPTPPPGFSRKRAKAAPEKKPTGKANLVLKIGGGEKRQLSLPLRTVADPFDKASAPASERAWYEKLKVAPKARP